MTLASPCAASGADLVIGQVAPLTGSNASNGQPLSQGIKLYFDQVNAAGGVNGKRIRFLVRDDGYKVEETVRHARELVDKEGVLALMTIPGTANNEALVREKVLSGAGVPLLGPRSGATVFYNTPGIFAVRASYHDEARAIVRQLTTTGLTRIAAVYQDDAFGKDVLTGLDAALATHQLALTARSSFERNTVKVESTVDEMIKNNPQAIVLIAITTPAAEFIKQYRARGGSAQVICLSIADPGLIVASAGATASRGLAMTVVWPTPDRDSVPVIREMLRAREEFGVKDMPPSLNMVEGYVAARVMVEALRRAGANPTRASLTRALTELGTVDVGGFPIPMDAAKHDQRYVELMVIGAKGKLMH